MCKLDLEKEEGSEIKLPTFVASQKKQKNSRKKKKVYFCFIDDTKALVCLDHNKLWKNLKEMGITEQLTCLPRSLYAGQKATFRTEHGKIDWFKIVKRVCQGLYIVTLLIQILCRVCLVKCWAG